MASYRVVFQPGGVSVLAVHGELVAGAAARAGVKINRHCGGAGVCGKCKIRAVYGSSFLGSVTDTEKRLLSAAETAAGVRLACCAEICGDGEIEVLGAIQEAGNRILTGLADEGMINWDQDGRGYGVAVDIGTTTVACYLLDLGRARIAACCSFLNPQVACGDDVISRISFSTSSPQALEQLKKLLTDAMNEAFASLAAQACISVKEIRTVVASGNTVMEHLFLGVSPESIGHSPYAPQFLTTPPMPAAQLGLKTADNAVVKLLPNVAGYVGADIVAGVAAYGLTEDDRVRMLIDIGTNNEIVIGSSRAAYCCATAAGPAFEGARIGQGMRACHGAVEKVNLGEHGVGYTVIGDEAPAGLCGSGLIDSVSVLVQNGVVNARGRMSASEECGDRRFKDRLGRDLNGMMRFLITDEDNPVYLTQKDVREVQLALGAVKVGVKVMMEHMGVTLAQIDEVLLAGAFGNNIDIGSAIAVGLLPDVPREKVRGVHNSSGLGSCMALASEKFYRHTESVMKKMHYVELSSLPEFQKYFIRAMCFKEELRK